MKHGRGGLEIGRFTSTARVPIIPGHRDDRNAATDPCDGPRPYWPAKAR